MSYRQALLQRLRVPPLPNYLKEEHERICREKKRMREEERNRKREKEEREREREKERKRILEDKLMKEQVSGSGGTSRCEMTVERSKRKRKRTEDDNPYTLNPKKVCPEGREKVKVKRIRSLHKMAAYAFIPFFNSLPDRQAQDVPEKWDFWFREIISYEEFQNIENRRKRLHELKRQCQ